MVWKRRQHEETHAVLPPDVWVVQHDESPNNTILGVFASEAEAATFAEEVQHRFPKGVIYAKFTLGYRYDSGPGYVTFGPDDTGK
ncbi:hypothetical protein [Rathayibacter tritici]|nr:hypothetical protein [Rathayibacter tritici]